MISNEENTYILQRAYIPEHLPNYVEAATGAETTLIQNCLVYTRESHLSLVAYPLTPNGNFQEENSGWLERLTSSLMETYNPQVFSIISPIRCIFLDGLENTGEDQYFRLKLDQVKPGKKIRNLLQHAERELTVVTDQKFDCRHKRLVNEFLKKHRVSPETRSIFKRLPRISKAPGCVLLSAFNQRGKLVAFDLFDFSADSSGFYLFNFYSRSQYVPGASDLLLFRGMQIALQQGKKYLNLGLGIHPGVEQFKAKWGSQPFLKYLAYQKEPDVEEAADNFFAKL
ncbi:MAG TPA: hypothetical protein VLM80_00925 [Anaerolineales bacterium]|nr:hypothetical protein [Anaerolineales bacterium]